MTKPWRPTDPAAVAEQRAWLRAQPKCVRDAAEKYPGGLYVNTAYEGKQQQVMLLYGYNSAKEGTVCTGALCLVTLEFNPFLIVERRVFDVKFEHLEGIPDHPDVIRKRVNALRGGLTDDEARALLPPPDMALKMMRGEGCTCDDPRCAFHQVES